VRQFSSLQYLRSFVFPIIVDRRQSRHHQYLEVSYTRGRLMLNTALANYSYGGLHRVFQIAFKKIGLSGMPLKNILILGFGAGSVATIIRDELKIDAPITGVEQDYTVLQIARDFFDIDRLHTLNLVTDDAMNYMQHCEEHYDLIVVDLYQDISVPAQFEENIFLKNVERCLMQGGLLVFNKVAATRTLYAQYKELLSKIENLFGRVQSIKALGINRVLVAEKR
jgi:spermidine synthase